KEEKINVLIATDIAARGIDVEELGLVINYDLPHVPETYVHRIGRTGRASVSGSAVSFCDREERPYLRDIQKLIDQKIPVIEEHPFGGENSEEEASQHVEKPRQKQQFHTRKQGNQSSNNSNRNNRRRPNSRNR